MDARRASAVGDDMSDPIPSRASSPPSAALAVAWLEQITDLLALTDATGRISWVNARFLSATGQGVGTELLALADGPDPGASTARMHDLLRGALSEVDELPLRSTSGSTLWVRARLARFEDRWLWTLQDTGAARELESRAKQLSERLATVQEFGRIGMWEREIPSGKGRWDRHVFDIWDIDPGDGTPNFAEAARRVHPDDHRRTTYPASTRRAGRYLQRFRVIRPDGSVRWIDSQWDVKNSPDGTPDRAVGVMKDDTPAFELARTLDSTSAQLKLAVDLGHIVVWRHDLKSNRLHYNDYGFEVLGIPYRAEGLMLEEVRALTHPDDVPKAVASAAQALRTGQPVDIEIRYRRSDGRWRHMLVRRVVERAPTGDALAFLGVSLDITDRVEHSLRSAELARRLESAAGAARIGIWSINVGTLRAEWNAQMFELFDIVGADHPPPLKVLLASRVHADDAAAVGTSVRDYLRLETGTFESEFRVRRQDGRTRWMVLRADFDRTSIDGKRVFGIAMDVTDRHDALAALHAASERAALIARSAGIGTWETHIEGGQARWDEQMFRLRGLAPRDTALGRDERLELVHPDDRANLLDAGSREATDRQPSAYEFRVRLPDGRYRWLASRSTVLCDEHGALVRRVGVNWDITEAKRSALAFQQAELAERESRAKLQFLSRMSHELRTPLNAVLGFTQLLQLEARASSSEAQFGKLDHIRAAGEHLLALIDDVLELSSLESGALRLEPQAVGMATAVTLALPMVEALAARHRVALRMGVLEGTALADPTRLRQVLLNLLTNAIKYNRPNGQVVVESTVVGERVELRVHDTGRGMQPEQLAHLFEPFNRLGAGSFGIEGTGIGLTIARAMVHAMDGSITASSEPDRGTVFEVTLPVCAAGLALELADGPMVASPAPTAPAAQRAGQLLYIEDNAVNVLLVEELVRSLPGLSIASEATGADGVARAGSLCPDLILVDMQLPDFDGFEVLRRLRARPQTAAIRCIALSANAMPEDIARGLAAGFDDYWTKPIQFKPFLEALKQQFPLGSAS
jgi:PAS domain S-box-containing protein